MLKLLLDEHISPAVAAGLRRRHRALVVICIVEWEGGGYIGQSDSVCLQQAAGQGLTLVTYDRRTIPPLLRNWGEEGRKHSGVVFVDERTIPPCDHRGLVRALSDLWVKTTKWDWSDRVCFLQR